MNLIKDLPELTQAGVISKETASAIQDFYEKKKNSSNNPLFIIFGILGSILVGLGIILILAHNWDELGRVTKTIIAFVPLVTGQLTCAYVFFKKSNSNAWSESASAFLFIAVGASISLISQIYNIPGNLGSFLLTWSLLCLPLIYLMKSSIASILYLIGITCFACEANYWSSSSNESQWFWFLYLGVLPHYYHLYKNKPISNFMTFHNWIIPISLLIVLGSVAQSTEELLVPAYFSLLGLFYLIGDLEFIRNQKSRNNGYRILSSIGTIGMLLVLSFDWYWDHLKYTNFSFKEFLLAPEFIATAIITILAGGLLVMKFKNSSFNTFKPISFLLLAFIGIFLVGMYSNAAIILINFCVLALGILTIRNGAQQNHLGIMNFGLLIITALVTCRFFDTDLSFVIRGIMFLAVGTGFFSLNYWLLKKRTNHA